MESNHPLALTKGVFYRLTNRALWAGIISLDPNGTVPTGERCC